MRKHGVILLSVFLGLFVAFMAGCKDDERTQRMNDETGGFERYDGFKRYEGPGDPETSVTDADASQDREGNYRITDPQTGTTVLIEPPEGFAFSDSAAHWITFSDGDRTAVDFSIVEAMTAEDVVRIYSDACLQEIEGECKNIQLSEVRNTHVCGMAVSYFSMTCEYTEGRICREYTAWTSIDTQTLLIAVSSTFDDVSAVGMEDSIVELMFECVKAGSDL